MKLIEFFTTPAGDILYTSGCKTPVKISYHDTEIVDELIEKIRETYPQAYSRLVDIYKDSARNKPYFQWRIVRRFIACNMGNYDTHHYDIDENGEFSLEEVSCPLRGDCLHENIICKAKPLTLTERELKVLELMSLSYSYQEIATILSIAYDTVKSHRRNMLSKLKFNDNTQLTSWYIKHFKK